ncbi:Rieske (2Fe-2S) protein [Pseudonocardia nantongensis]|uniref:Rieske (2Fe-2S) protein n=1 Tax=Pseudonocardia nantongensis TaxID=1181885 RepID=UPI00397D6DA6
MTTFQQHASRPDDAAGTTDEASAPRRGGPALGRRAMLAGSGAVALGTVAACGGGTTGDGGGQQQTGDAPAGAPGTVLGPASEVPVGGGKVYADQQLVVTQPTAGQFTGLSSVCTHQGCSVSSIEGDTIICPCHDSRFGLDGAVRKGPAQQPLQSRPVTVADGSVTLA